MVRTMLQCCREAKAALLVERVLRYRVPEEEELMVRRRLWLALCQRCGLRCTLGTLTIAIQGASGTTIAEAPRQVAPSRNLLIPLWVVSKMESQSTVEDSGSVL